MRPTLIGVFPSVLDITSENLTRLCSLAKALRYPYYFGVEQSNLNNTPDAALYLYFDCVPHREEDCTLILPSLSELWHTPESKRTLWSQLKKHKYEK